MRRDAGAPTKKAWSVPRTQYVGNRAGDCGLMGGRYRDAAAMAEATAMAMAMAMAMTMRTRAPEVSAFLH
jgi:hypothetical protein